MNITSSLLKALCNDDANGNVALGKSCNRYWQCQGGYPRLQRCPAMLVFDKHSLRCVVPPTEDCDVPTTPPPIDGEVDEDSGQFNPNANNNANNANNQNVNYKKPIQIQRPTVQRNRERDNININNELRANSRADNEIRSNARGDTSVSDDVSIILFGI